MQIVGWIVMLGCLICFVMVLVKLFQEKGILHGILGLICSLYTFIWGWMNATRLGIRNIMIIWTLLALVALVLNVAFGGMTYSFGTPTTP